jgi:hypothetical protein
VLDIHFSNLHKVNSSKYIQILENLDKVYTVKTFRYLSSPTDKDSLLQLADHFSRVSADLFFDQLELPTKRYVTRWKAYLDLIQIALRVVLIEKKTLDSKMEMGNAPRSWHWISQRVRSAGASGLEWAALMESILAGEADDAISIRTKSGLSMLVTSMRHAGWLQVVAHGRTRKLYLGNRASIELDSSEERLNRLAINEGANNSRPIIEICKNATCLQSGRFLDFLLSASERHKALKDSFPKDDVKSISKKSRQRLLDLAPICMDKRTLQPKIIFVLSNAILN